jgi:hypothetical protein
MVSRPGRPKASDIPDAAVLSAAAGYGNGGLHTLTRLEEQFRNLPPKVLMSKKAKMVWLLTRKGLDQWEATIQEEDD